MKYSIPFFLMLLSSIVYAKPKAFKVSGRIINGASDMQQELEGQDVAYLYLSIDEPITSKAWETENTLKVNH